MATRPGCELLKVGALCAQELPEGGGPGEGWGRAETLRSVPRAALSHKHCGQGKGRLKLLPFKMWPAPSSSFLLATKP